MQTKLKTYTWKTDTRIYKRAETAPTPSGPTTFVGGLHDKQYSVESEVTNWDWKQIIARSESATSFLQGTKWESAWGHDGFAAILLNHYNDKGQLTGHSYYSLNGAFYGFDDPINDSAYQQSLFKADNQALVRLNESIASAQRDLQGSVALGELAEALRMIRRPGIGLRKGFDRYLASVKKRFKGKKRWNLQAANEAVADSWLEHAFGWKPLLHDIDDGAKALANALNWHPERVRIFGKGTDLWRSGHLTRSGGDVLHGALLLKRDKYIRVGEVNVYYEGYIGYSPVAVDQVDFKRFGLGIDQFIPSIWELIPYSFVVDYFSNVGAVLQAYSNSLSTNILWLKKGTRTRRSAEWVSVTLEPYTPPQYTEVVYQRFSPGETGLNVGIRMYQH